MTPSSAPDAATDRQTVGDILLARGYVSHEQLEDAVASQQRSGKPLGQVLVEAGAITRLELASALAEQWSDTATWLGPPEESKRRDSKRARPSLDDAFTEGREAGYAEQLQNAVVELARRVASFEPVITDLKLRVETAEVGGPEKLLDRIEVVQDGVTSLARRLDELTDGVERAFTSVEQSSGEVTEELDALASRVALAAERAALDEIRLAVEELSGRPTGDPVLAAQVETLAGRLEELREVTATRADSEALDALRSAVDELAEQVTARADSGALDELHTALAELAARPQADPGQAERLDALTARIEASASTDALEALRSAVEEIATRPTVDLALTARVDELAARVAASADTGALDELRAAVAEVAARPQADPGLAAQLEALTARIEALAGTDALEAVRAAVEEMAGRPAADPVLTARIDELGSRLDEAVDAIGTRADHSDLNPLRETLDELAGRVASLADAQALEDLRASVEEVAARPPVAPELLEQLSELAARIELLSVETDTSDAGAVLALRGKIEELTTRSFVDPELERRVDNVVGRLDAVHARVEEVAVTLLSSNEETLADLRATVEDLAGRSAVDHATEHDVAAIRGELDALAASFLRIDDLAERLGRVEDAPTATAEEASTPDLAETLRAELESRIAEVASRTDGLAQETAGAVGAWVSERAGLEARIDALATELAEARFQATAALTAAEPSPSVRRKAKVDESEPAAVESELERLRMAVERINLHLGERERAIAELMRSRSGEMKIEELAARLVELEQNGSSSARTDRGEVALGGSTDLHAELRELALRLEDTEQSAKADRDKVLTQLERMASSIDWRFRRLESGETDAAA